MVCMTLDCVRIKQFSVIRIIYRNVGLKRFLHLPKFLLLSLVFAYIYISQGSVKTHLPCGEIYNHYVIVNCLQSVSIRYYFYFNLYFCAQVVNRTGCCQRFLQCNQKPN